jgi:hypothetical protein
MSSTFGPTQVEQHDPCKGCNNAAIEMLVHKVSRLEEAIGKMADSVNRLAIMEERQMADRAAVERAFTEISKLKEMTMEHEKQIMLNARTSIWVERAVWAAACAAVLAIASGKHII